MPDGSGERLLAQGYLVEGPTWAPNGRVLCILNKKLQLTMEKVLLLIYLKLILQDLEKLE